MRTKYSDTLLLFFSSEMKPVLILLSAKICFFREKLEEYVWKTLGKRCLDCTVDPKSRKHCVKCGHDGSNIALVNWVKIVLH